MLGQLRNEIGKRAVASSCDAAADEELRWGAEEEMTRIPTQSSLRSQRPQLLTRLEENRMLKITFRETAEEERWALHGLLTERRVQECKPCWEKIPDMYVRRVCIVNLNEVMFIDKRGERVLRLLAKDA